MIIVIELDDKMVIRLESTIFPVNFLAMGFHHL